MSSGTKCIKIMNIPLTRINKRKSISTKYKSCFGILPHQHRFSNNNNIWKYTSEAIDNKVTLLKKEIICFRRYT